MNDESLLAIVRDYIQTHREPASEELHLFRRQESLLEVVRLASLAVGEEGKRFPHQYRLRRDTLQLASAALLASLERISGCRSFDELHALVEEVVGDLPGIGELYVYDTSLRIGAKQRMAPDRVYLHRGTREGARALGLDGRRPAMQLSELPSVFSQLEPHEVEDCLCIYKEDLKLIAQGHSLPDIVRASNCRYGRGRRSRRC